MKFRSFEVGVAIAVLAVVGLVSPVKAAEQVPFQGRLEGVVTRGVVNYPFVSILIEGSGNATQLGHFTFAAPHVVNLTTKTAVGLYQFTAPNGDTLFATFTGQASTTSTPGVLYIVENATVVGGTGRFAGATGSFTIEKLYDIAAGTTTGNFEGTILSVGASKH